MGVSCSVCGKKGSGRINGGKGVLSRKCQHCGGPLKGATAGRPSPSMGRRYEWCVLCGAKSLKHRHPKSSFRFGKTGSSRVFPPRSPVCAAHLLSPE